MAADTAELFIRPRLVGDVTSQLEPLTRAVRTFTSQQVSGLRSVETQAMRTERAFDLMGRGIEGSSRLMGGLVRGVFSLRTAVAGLVVGGVGRTFIEATIGSNDQVQRARLQLRAILQDEGAVNAAVERARVLTTEVASIDFAGAIRGMGLVSRLAGGNVDNMAELVKLAKALETLSPEQGFEGALFALKELESGDTVSLRSRFNIRLPTRAEAEAMADEAGQTLSEFYFDRLNGFLDQTYGGGVAGTGVEALLGISNQTISGQLQMLQTGIQDVFLTIGESASEVARRRIPELTDRLDELKADPQFREDIEGIADGLANAVDATITLASNLPQHLRDLRAWIDEHEGAIKLVGGFAAANFLTGGVAGQAATSAAAGGVRLVGRGIAGALRRRGGAAGAAGALAGAAAGADAVPVYVVNFGEAGGGGAGRGFLSRNAAGLGGAAAGGGALTSTELASLGLAGAGTSTLTLVAGGALAGLALLGVQLGALGVVSSRTAGASAALAEEEARLRQEREQRAQQVREDYTLAVGASGAGRRQRINDIGRGVAGSEALPIGPLTEAAQNRLLLTDYLTGAMNAYDTTGRLYGVDSSGRGVFTNTPLQERAQTLGNSVLGLLGSDQVYNPDDANQTERLRIINESLSTRGLAFDPVAGQTFGAGRFRPRLSQSDAARRAEIEGTLGMLQGADGQPVSEEARQVLGQLQSSGELRRLYEERDRLNALEQSARDATATLNNRQRVNGVDFRGSTFSIVIEAGDGRPVDEAAAEELYTSIQARLATVWESEALAEE